jgi:hypothetical protein
LDPASITATRQVEDVSREQETRYIDDVRTQYYAALVR